jgi:hypothetical protein
MSTLRGLCAAQSRKILAAHPVDCECARPLHGSRLSFASFSASTRSAPSVAVDPCPFTALVYDFLMPSIAGQM